MSQTENRFYKIKSTDRVFLLLVHQLKQSRKAQRRIVKVSKLVIDILESSSPSRGGPTHKILKRLKTAVEINEKTLP